MTEQERAMIVAIGDALRANPISWEQIDQQTMATVIAIMEPRPTFTPEQRGFLDHWWLEVNDEQLAEINAKLPSHNVVSPRLDNEGSKWISADLFTDAALPGKRLYAILPELLSLALYYHEDDSWPVMESEP